MLALLTLLLAAPGVAASEDTPKAPEGPDGPEAPGPPPGRDTDGDEDGEPQDEADDDDEGRGPSWMRSYNLVGLGLDPLTFDTGRPKFAFSAEIGAMLLKTKWQDKSVGIGIGLASMLYGREFVVRGDIPIRIAIKPGFVDVGGGIAWPVTDFDLGTPRAPMVHGFGRAGVAALGGQLGVQGMVSIGIEPIYTAGIFLGGPGPGRLSKPSDKAYEPGRERRPDFDAPREESPALDDPEEQEKYRRLGEAALGLMMRMVSPEPPPEEEPTADDPPSPGVGNVESYCRGELVFEPDLRGAQADGRTMVLFMQQTGVSEPHPSEEHPIGQTDTGARRLSLETGVPVSESGTTTVFRCDDPDILFDTLTFAVRLYDQDGSLLDCLIWGDDPSTVIQGSRRRTTEPSNAEELRTCRQP